LPKVLEYLADPEKAAEESKAAAELAAARSKIIRAGSGIPGGFNGQVPNAG